MRRRMTLVRRRGLAVLLLPFWVAHVVTASAVPTQQLAQLKAFRGCPANSFLWGWRGARAYCVRCPSGTASTGCTSALRPVSGYPVCRADRHGKLCAGRARAALRSCKSGQFRASGNVCATCPAGKWQSRSGKTLCYSCPAGMYQPQKGMQACYNCPVGRYNSRSAGSACAKCDKCPKGRYGTTSSTGKKVERDCFCADCAAGMYAPSGV